LEIVKLLLSIPGIDVDLADELGRTPFIIACQRHDLEMMKAIAEFYGPRLNEDSRQLTGGMVVAFARPYSDDAPRQSDTAAEKIRTLGVEPYTPRQDNDDGLLQFFFSFSGIDAASFPGNGLFIVAAKSGNNELLKSLLELQQFDQNSFDEQGRTPLICCCAGKNLEGVKLLISHPKTNVNIRDVDGDSAFVVAADCGKSDILSALVQCSNFNKNDILLGLLRAIEHDDRSVVSFILSLDFDINARVENIVYRQTRKTFYTGFLLGRAVSKNDFQLILDIGKHPRFDPRLHNVQELLLSAIKIQDTRVFSALRSISNNVARDADLLVQACLDDRRDIAGLIVSEPDFKLSRIDGSRALAACFKASAGNLFETIAKIPGVDINANLPATGTVPGQLPPVYATLRMKESTGRKTSTKVSGYFKPLLAMPSVDLNVRGEDGVPLLCEASKHGLAEAILEHDGRYVLDIQDYRGRTALMYAVEAKSMKDVKALVMKGIDLGVKDMDGKTAWELAHVSKGVAEIPEEPADREVYIKALEKLLKK
jgi:ankyrin repeat protein